MKTKSSLLLIPLVIACFALLAMPRALGTDFGSVLPNANTADGSGVLVSLTTGVNNSGFGFQTLNHDSSGSGNTATGYRALYTNNAGSFNTAVGETALYSNSSGTRNTAVGDGALLANATASSNTAVGVSALRNNVSGAQSTAVGHDALSQNNANGNTAVGYQSLLSNTGGIDNTATGYQALLGNTTGRFNTSVGAGSLFHNNGSNNTAVGNGALTGNSTGGNNTAVGFLALRNTNGIGNTAIGLLAGSQVTNASNVICIGSGGANVSNSCYIGSIFGQSINSATATGVFIDTNGKLGTTVSARRFKRDIQPMDKTSEAILALKPVTFRYKSDLESTPCFGLVAEDVEKVNPSLVVRDKNGELLTVRYEAVNAMLLNEFLKEHRRVEEQNQKIKEQAATIADLKAAAAKQEQINSEQQKEMKALTVGLQKINARLELSKAPPQVARNRP